MFNQRGQAFSVFELMIAAIVAVAILFVLLPILSNINNQGGVQAAKDAISNGLASVKGGGPITTQSFDLGKDDLLTSKMFADKGFDQHSIVFDVDNSLAGSSTQYVVETTEVYSFVRYTGSTGVTVVARIICEQTGDSLDETLGDTGLDTTLYDGTGGEALCGNSTDDTSEVYQPCCIVILKRAS